MQKSVTYVPSIKCKRCASKYIIRAARPAVRLKRTFAIGKSARFPTHV